MAETKKSSQDLTKIRPDHLLPSSMGQPLAADPTRQAGESQYDVGISPQNVEYLNESRATQQTALAKFGNGLANATTSAATTALEGTIGFGYGLTKFLITGEVDDIYSNELTNNVLDPLSKFTREKMPFYYSESEKDAPFYQGLVPFTEGSANFWFDKVFNGAGYMLGSVVGGMGLSKVFKLGKAAALGGEELLSASADDIMKGYKSAALANQRLDMSKQFGIGLALGHSEAALEARETYKASVENLEKLRADGVEGYADLTDAQIHTMSTQSANFNYAGNLAIVGPTDMLLLGKLINPGAKQSIRKYNKITRTVDEAGNLVLKDATLSNKYRGLLNGTEAFFKGAGTEAFQEGAQFASNVASQEFIKSYTLEKQPWFDAMVDGISTGLAETFNTKEGLESMLIGGLIGGPVGWKGSKGERLAREEATQQKINFLKEDLYLEGLTEKGKKAVEAMDYFNSGEEAMRQGDMFEAKNKEANGFKSYVEGYIKHDATDYLIERLETFKQAPVDEFKKQFGYEESAEVNQAEVLDKLINEVKDLKELHENINEVFGINTGTPEELAANKLLKDKLFTSSFNIKNIEKREKQIASELQKITGAGELLRLREVAIKAGKFDEQSMETYREILGEKDAVKYEKFIEEYGNDYLKAYNAAVKQFTQDYPVESTQVTGMLEDLNKLADRREQFIKYHNALLNKDARDKIMDQELLEIFKKAQETQAATKKPTSTPEEVDEIFQNAPDKRNNVTIDPTGNEVDLAKTSLDKLRQLKQESLNSYQNLDPNSEEAAKLEKFLAAIDEELNTKQQRDAKIQDLREKFRNASTVEELTDIANKIKALGVDVDQTKFAKAVERVVAAQQKSQVNQELNNIAQVINENFKGAREFTEVVFYRNRADVQRKIQDILNNPANLTKVKARLTKQAQRKSTVGGGRVPENPNVEKISPPIVIELVYDGMPIGFLSYYDMFIDKSTGKAINIQSPSFTLAEYKRLFQPDLSKSHTSFEGFKEAHANLATLYQKLADMLGSENTMDVDAEELNKLVGLKVSMGLFQPLETAEPLDSYDVYSRDGVRLIVDTSVKHQSAMSKEAVGPNEIPVYTYETSFSDVYEPNLQDIAAGDTVDPKLKEAFEALSNLKNNPKSGNAAESRYWTLVAMPQGQVTIEGKSYSWIPVTPNTATPADIKEALVYIGQQFDTPPTSDKGKGAIIKQIKSMLFFASAIDRDYKNNIEVTLMPGYQNKTILMRLKSEVFKSVNNGNPNVYIEVPYTQDPQQFLDSLEAERKKNALLTNLTPFTPAVIKKSTPKNLYELGLKVNEAFLAKVAKDKTNQHIILQFDPEEKKAGQPLSNAEKQAKIDQMMGKAQGQSGALTNEEKQAKVNKMMGLAQAPEVQPAAEPSLPKVKDNINDTPVLKSAASNFETLYIPRRIYELAYQNDEINKTRTGGAQSLDTIIQRGGYTIEELNKLLPNWKKLLTTPAPTAPTTAVKPGVLELFESNPELASIGTPEQYSAYLDTIFPDSKVKDILYHSRFNVGNIKNKSRWRNGFYSGTKDQADLMADMAESSNDLMTTSALLINMQNPKVTTYTDRKVEDYENTNDGFIIEATEKDALQLIGDRDGYNIENFKKEYVVFEPEQIHILGSKQDIEGFKKFIATPRATPTQPAAASVSTKKSSIKGNLAEQGTSIELEVVGETGKEFLLVVDRKGNISLFSEKQPDGSYKSGDPVPKETVINLYKKYIPTNTIFKIQKWLASFTGSWAAPETEDGKNYEKAEKELIEELATLSQPSAAPVSNAKADIERRLKEEIISLEEEFKTLTFKDGNTLFGKNGSAYKTAIDAARYGIKETFKRVFPEYQTKADRYIYLTEQFDKAVQKELDALEGAAPSPAEQISTILNTPIPDNVKNNIDNAGLGKVDKGDTLNKKANDEFGFKRVPTTVLTEEEKIDLDKAKAWLKTVLPSGIDVALVDEITNNVLEGYTSMGQFLNACVVLSKAAKKGTERHEAFHVIFRTCLTNEQQDYYYKAAERDMAKEFTAKGKSINKAFREFLDSNPELAESSSTVQKHFFLEEYMADKYEAYTPKAKPTTLIEKLFNTLKKVVNFFSNDDISEELTTLFSRIDRGYYTTKGAVTNRYGTVAYKIAANQRIYTGHNTTTDLPTYLPTPDQIREVNYLTSKVLERLKEEVSNNEDLENLTLEEVVDQVLNERLDYFDPSGAKWQSLIQANDTFGISRLYDLHFIYKLAKNEATGEWQDSTARSQMRAELLQNLTKYGVDENLEILNESETDDGSSPERNFNDNQENQGGFGSLSRALKRHIATTTYTVTLNEFFNTDVFSESDTITLAVDPKQVYDGLTRACQNEPDLMRLLEKMAAMQENSSEAGRYVERLFRETGVVTNIDGSVDITNVPSSNLQNDLLRAVKGFNLYSLDYLFTSIDPTGQLSQTILANTRDVDKIQVERWSQLFRTKSKDVKNAQLATLSRLKSFATTGTNKIPNPEGGVDFVIPDDRLNGITIAAQDALREHLGIKLSKGIIKYLLLNNPRLIKSEAQQKFVSLYANQIKYSNKDFVDFLDTLSSIIEKGDNPFIRRIDPETKKEVAGGMVTKLETIAKVNAIFDETVEQPSFINGEGKTVYAFQHATYNIVKALDIADPSKTNLERLTELADNNPSLKFVLNNFLLQSPQFQKVQHRLHIKRIDAIRERKLVMEDEDIKIDTQNRVTEGIVYGAMNDREFLLTQYALYANTKTDMIVGEGEVIPARDILITVMEASNTGDAITLPIVQAIRNDGTIDPDYIKKRVDIIKNEHARILRVKAGEFKNKIQEFNTGSKRRGEKFWADNTLILNTILADAEINTEGVTLEELENAESLDNYNDMLTKGMEMYLQKAIDRHILKLAEAGIISINEKNELQNNFLPKGFSTQLKVDDANYIFPTGNLRANIAQVYLSNEINTIAINELLYGDPALGLKDFQDKFKRDKGSNASGMNTVTLDWKNNQVKDEFRYFVYGEQENENSKLADPSVDNYRLTSKGTVLKIRDANGQLTQEFLDFAKAENLSNEEIDELSKSNTSIDLADAQGLGTVELFRDIYESIGRMTPRGYKIYDQIEKGEEVNEEDWQYLQDNDIMLNSLKMVYYDGQTYIKFSVTHLSKQMTSYYDKDTNTWKPRKGQEWQHDVRENMERMKVQFAGPPSMSKKMIVNPVKLEANNKLGAITEDNISIASRKFFRLQQENPSNKLRIKDPTQMLQILATEQKDDTPIIYEADPSIKTIGELKQKYSNLLGSRVLNEFYSINSFISDIKEGKTVPNLSRFIKVFSKTLRETGASDKLLDMLEVDSQGKPIYNFNLPDVARKFEEMFNAHFNKALSLTVPGYKVTLQSGLGHEVIIEKSTGRIIPRYEYNADPKKYESDEYTTRPLEYNVPRKVKRKVTMTLPGLAPIETEEEVVVGSYAEVILPAHFRELFGLEPGDTIPEEIAYMFGVRIPSQDKHSALSLKVVDFLPAEYGSNAVFPHEIVLLTGSDFDIDSFYIHRPDHYIKYVDGKAKFMAYGNKEDSKISQFVRWHLENNSLLKGEIQDRLKANTSLYNEVKNLATSKNFAQKLIAENKTKISKLETSEFKVMRDALAAADEIKKLKKANKQLIAEYRSVSEKIRAIKEKLAIDTMKSLKLPTTEEELTKSGLENLGALNNALLEAKMLLHDNPYVNKEINKTPASLSAIQNKGKTGVLDKLAQALGYKGYEDMGEPETTSSLSGMVKAFVSNKAGSKAIGAAVNSTQLYSSISRFGITRNSKLSIVFDGFKLFEISRNSFVTKAGERIMDILSTLTSSMTDNAKYGYNSKLNLDSSSLGVVSYGVMHGVDLQTMVFLLNQDAVLDYVKANKSYAIETIFESQGRYKRVEAVKNDLLAKLAEADPTFNLDEFMKTPLQINLDELTYSLQGPDGKGMAKNSKNYVMADINRRKAIEAFKKKDVRYLRAQLTAFLAYEEMEKNSNYLLNTIHPIKLTKGLTSRTDRSFNADDQLISALRKLNIEGYIDPAGEIQFRYFDTSDKGMAGMTYDVLPILNSDPLIKQNLAVVLKKQGLAQQLFISKLPFSQKLKNVIIENMPMVKKAVSSKILNNFRRNIESYLSIKAFRKLLKDKHVPNVPDLNELLYGDLISQIDKFRKANPEFNQNLFLNSLAMEKKPGGFVSIAYHTRGGGMKGFEDRIRNDADTLFGDSEGAKILNKLFFYCIAKDGLQYKNNGIVSILPSHRFLAISKQMDRIMDTMQKGDAGIQELFGQDRNTIEREFVELFYRDTNNYRGLKQIRTKNFKAPFFKQTATTLVFNATGGVYETLSPEQEAANKKLFGQQIQIFEQEFGLVDKKVKYPPVIRTYDAQTRASTYYKLVKLDGKEDFKIDESGLILGKYAEYEATSRIGTTNISVYPRTIQEAEALNEKLRAEEDTFSPAAMEEDGALDNPLPSADQLKTTEALIQGKPTPVKKIISGFQTGVDTIGLQVAKMLGLETGGTAPRGFLQESGKNPAGASMYGVQEISEEAQADYRRRNPNKTDAYTARTEQNVKNSDGTVYFSTDADSAGKIATKREADRLGKPFIENPTAAELKAWLIKNNIQTLNVAGNRGSKLSSEQIKQIEQTLIGALVESKPTTEDTVEAKVKEGFMMNKASGENAVNLQVEGTAASIISIAEKRKAVKDYLLQLEQAYTEAGNTVKANAAKAERAALMTAEDPQAVAMYKKYLC